MSIAEFISHRTRVVRAAWRTEVTANYEETRWLRKAISHVTGVHITSPEQLRSESTAMSSSLLGLPPVPPDLKSIAPYLQRAEELKNQDPVVSYWCKLHGSL